MLARHRRVSLSKAVEYCVALTIQDYEIDGAALAPKLMFEVPDGYPLMGEAWAAQLLASPGKRALWMPASLRTPEEEYFERVVRRIEEIGQRVESYEGDTDELFELAKISFSRGVREEDLADHWISEMLDRVASDEGKVR